MAKAPSTFMQATRPHTYQGHPKDVGDIYLAYEDDVENIENLKFAKRVPSPPRLTRASVQPLKPVASLPAAIQPPQCATTEEHHGQSHTDSTVNPGPVNTSTAAVDTRTSTEAPIDTAVTPRRRRTRA